MDAVTSVPTPVNEPVKDYAPGSPERAAVEAALADLASSRIDLPMTIGGRQVMGSGRKLDVVQPHARRHVLGTLRHATREDAAAAVAAAKAAAPGWRAMAFDDRASIFLKAADLLAGPWRPTLNAATMLGQSKTVYQAEIDAACELIDFWRFNVALRSPAACRAAAGERQGRVEPQRPPAARGLRLRDHAVQLHGDRRQPADRARAHGQRRHLEAVTHPAARRALHDAAARGGRPAARRHQPGDGRRDRRLRGRCSRDPDLAGIHFTGSTADVPDAVARRRREHRRLPRATRGSSARPAARTSSSPTRAPTSTCCARRWSAARSSTRARSAQRRHAPTCPRSVWKTLEDDLVATTDVPDGGPGDRPVELHGRRHRRPGLRQARRGDRPGHARRPGSRSSPAARTTTVRAGSSGRRSSSAATRPTRCSRPSTSARSSPSTSSRTGSTTSVLRADGVHRPVRPDRRRSSPRTARRSPRRRSVLRFAAGNFYINDKPTGAVVGQQPFGGARASGHERQGRCACRTCCAGRRRVRSRRRSCRRRTTATRTWHEREMPAARANDQAPRARREDAPHAAPPPERTVTYPARRSPRAARPGSPPGSAAPPPSRSCRRRAARRP